MQSIFIGEDQDESSKLPTTNLDFSIGRCRPEKLQEQMTAEKAATILQIPTGRGMNMSDRRVLDKKFINMLHKRHKIPSNDPDYEKKVENRHVLDVLVHESYQYMIKQEKAELSKTGSGTGSEIGTSKKSKKIRKSSQISLASSSVEADDQPDSSELSAVDRMSKFNLRKAVIQQEEKEQSKNILVNRMMEKYLSEDLDPIFRNQKPEYEPRIALLD